MQSGGDALRGREITGKFGIIANGSPRPPLSGMRWFGNDHRKEKQGAEAREPRSLSARFPPCKPTSAARVCSGPNFRTNFVLWKHHLTSSRPARRLRKGKSRPGTRVSDLTNDLHRAQADLVAANLRSENFRASRHAVEARRAAG